jgi:RNA polymerase sigma-70 factor (ECF subfamily)
MQKMDTLEWHLVEKARNGDNRAFDKLFLQHQKYLFNLMAQLTGDRAWADDLTQEALILAYQKISSFRHASSFRTWLSKIAINLFRNKYRCRPRHSSLCLEELRIPSCEDGPERTVIKRELQWCIAHNLQQHIPKNYRVVLVLRDLHRLSYKEISEILGWSMSRTKTSLHRARQMFRSQFIDGKCKAFAENYLCICEGILDL